MNTTAPPDRIDASRAALIVYDACRRALTPADPARRAAMRPVLDAWVALMGACRARAMPIIYTTPVSRADGADIVLLPTDLSVETGVPSLTNCVEGTPDAGFPEEIARDPRTTCTSSGAPAHSTAPEWPSCYECSAAPPW